jgi:hypothetical protein
VELKRFALLLLVTFKLYEVVPETLLKLSAIAPEVLQQDLEIG